MHTLWHDCLDTYQDPTKFSTYLNACIQAARNVTFALQKEKRSVPGFEDWYGPWQEAMRRSPIMKWSVVARNTVVKEGDLATESITRATLNTDYLSLAELVGKDLGREYGDGTFNLEPPATATLPELLEKATRIGLPKSIWEDAVLYVERRWVDSRVPSWELLDALAYVHSFLTALVHDLHATALNAHGMDSVSPASLTDTNAVEVFRPACMVTTLKQRSIAIRVLDGGFVSKSVQHPMLHRVLTDPSTEDWNLPRVVLDREPENALDFVEGYLEIGREILKRHPDHGWFITYFRGATRVDVDFLAAQNVQHKWALAQGIAAKAIRLGADSVIETGEAWYAPISTNEDGTLVPARDHVAKKEVLMIHAETADGRVKGLLLPFARTFYGSLSIEEEPIESSTPSNFLAPLRAAWRQTRTRRQ